MARVNLRRRSIDFEPLRRKDLHHRKTVKDQRGNRKTQMKRKVFPLMRQWFFQKHFSPLDQSRVCGKLQRAFSWISLERGRIPYRQRSVVHRPSGGGGGGLLLSSGSASLMEGWGFRLSASQTRNPLEREENPHLIHTRDVVLRSDKHWTRDLCWTSNPMKANLVLVDHQPTPGRIDMMKNNKRNSPSEFWFVATKTIRPGEPLLWKYSDEIFPSS